MEIRKPSPPVIKILPKKVVLRIERKKDGSVDKYKAGLVVLGNLKVEIAHFSEAFSSVADFTVVRVALCVAAMEFWEVEKWMW